MSDAKEVVDTSSFSMKEEEPLLSPVKAPDIKLPAKEAEPVKLPISDEDKDKYFNNVLTNKPYEEILKACGGKLEIGFRTRTVQESEQIITELNKALADKKIDYLADYQNKHLMCHIAYAVTSINGLGYDMGPLEERVGKLMKLDTQIYMVLIELINRFDDKMNRLREEALKPNF